MTEAILEECQHLLPRVLCRTCSATFWERATGKPGPLTVTEKEDQKLFFEQVEKSLEPVLVRAEANLADVRQKIERYISNKL